jgi:exonuclease III
LSDFCQVTSRGCSESPPPTSAAYLKEARDRGRELLVCGDWNIAHTEADIKSWKTNLRSSGFPPEERAWLGEVFTEFVDVVRDRHPGTAGPYTGWSYRGRAFDRILCCLVRYESGPDP